MAVDKSSILNIASNTAPGNYLPNLRQTFNNTQNWTVPTGVRGIIVVMAGGGGGGGSSNSGQNFGASAGGGGGTGVEAVGVIPGDTVAVTIGAGGAGAVANSLSDGASGGTTTVGVGNTLLIANGGSAGRAGNNNNGAGGGSSGNFVVGPKTAGSIGTQIPIPTNVVIDFGESSSVFFGSTSNATWNSISRGNNIFNSTGVGDAFNGSSILSNVGNLSPYSGNNTNIVTTTNTYYAAYSGSGGHSGNYDGTNNGYTTNGSNTYSISPRDGISGLVGGGGGASNLNGNPSGAGGGGHGGFGGAMNTTTRRGGSGGGGLIDAGVTNTTASGGAGGTGGGGGGGGVADTGAGGAGGAGAVLIYY
jgi:hypothetical protein